MYEGLHEIAARYHDIDFALLHLGGTRVLGVRVTMDGRQGRRAMEIVRPRLGIPIHYDDYTVFKSPLRDFQREAADAGLEERVRYLRHGDVYEFAGRAGGVAAGSVL